MGCRRTSCRRHHSHIRIGTCDMSKYISPKHFFARTIKIASYSTFIIAGLISSGLWQHAYKSQGYSVTKGEELRNALLVGVAHADVPMCGAYLCTGSNFTGDGGDGGGGGGGDCGDGGSDGGCN